MQLAPVSTAIDDVNTIITAPIVAKVDTVHLFLATGIILIAVIIWSRILAHILD